MPDEPSTDRCLEPSANCVLAHLWLQGLCGSARRLQDINAQLGEGVHVLKGMRLGVHFVAKFAALITR